MKKAEIADEIRPLEKKYFDLVWYSRTTPDEPASQAGRKRVEAELAGNVAALWGDDTNWQHGFNSGCLAAFRLVQGLLGSQADAEMAREMFPFLDT